MHTKFQVLALLICFCSGVIGNGNLGRNQIATDGTHPSPSNLYDSSDVASDEATNNNVRSSSDAPTVPVVDKVCRRIRKLMGELGRSYDLDRFYCDSRCDFDNEIKCSASPDYGFPIPDFTEGMGERKFGKTVTADAPYVYGSMVERISRFYEDFGPLTVLIVGLLLVAIVSMTKTNSFAKLLVGIVILFVAAFQHAYWGDLAIFFALYLLLALARSFTENERGSVGLFVFTFVATVASSFFDNPYIGVCIGAVVLVAVVYIGYRILSARDLRESSALFMLASLIYVWCRIASVSYIRQSNRSFIPFLAKAVAQALLPFGELSTVIGNCIDSADIIYSWARREFGAEPIIAVVLVVLMNALFIFGRAVVGWLAIRRHYAHTMSLESFAYGFYAYSVDVLCPLRLVLVLFDEKRRRNKAIWFCGITNIALLVFEWQCGKDFLIFRVCLAAYDFLFMKGNCIHLSMQLEEFDLVLDMPMKFACVGSLASFDLAKVGRLAQSVVTVTTDHVRGTGMVLTRNGRRYLRTVSHVGDALVGNVVDMIHSGGTEQVQIADSVASFGARVDPITDHLIRDGVGVPVEGADLRDLSPSEHDSVDFLLALSGRHLVTPVSEFKLDPTQGIINLAIDSIKGDSGTAICAVLNNGAIRYAGTLSRGMTDSTAFNLATMFVPGDMSGSPGHGDDDPVVFDTAEDFETPRDFYTQFHKQLRDMRNDTKVRDPKVPDGRTKKYRDLLTTHSETLRDVLTGRGYHPDSIEAIVKTLDDDEVIEFNALRRLDLQYVPKIRSGVGANKGQKPGIGYAGPGAPGKRFK